MNSDLGEEVTGEGEAARGLVPKLRFPEFRQADGWKEKPLSALARVNPPSPELPPSFVYIDLGVVDNGRLTAVNVIQKDGAPSRAQRVLSKGDILFQMVRPYQRNNLFFDLDSHDFVASTGYAQLRSRGPSQFLHQIIHADYFVDRVVAKCTGSNYPAINSSDLAAIPVLIPEEEEQQKVADCLSSLDAVIAAEGERLAALRTHKAGLLQALFPAPGQTTPRLRFPEFRDAGEWEERPLGKICDVAQGFGFPDRMQGKSSGEYPFCKVSDISRAVNENGGLLDTATNYVDHADLKTLGARTIPAGATVFAKIGEALRLNRRAITGVVCLIDNNAVALKAKDGATAPYFLFSLSQTIDMNDYCGGAVPSVNKSTLEAIVVQAPGLAEQTKVAGYFQSIDSVIASQLEQIHALKAHKSGLMQQLFPPPAELSA